MAFLRSFVSRAALGGGLALALAGSSHAAIVVFQNDLAGFNLAAGNPAIKVTFDNIDAGTDIDGMDLGGVTISSPEDNTLIVVNAADTFSPPGYGGPGNTLPSTTPPRVLSPGGPELVAGDDEAQRDTVLFTFGPTVTAFGVDVLFQSLDGFSFATYTVRSLEGNTLRTGSIDIGSNGGSGGSFFIGFMSDNPAERIGSIIISDLDDNAENPDSNLGYDTLRFGVAVPEPSVWAMMIGGFGLAGGMLRRRRQAAVS